MATQKETPISDEELDALMAELEVETQGMVMAPTTEAALSATAPAPVPSPEVDFPDDQELAEMAAAEAVAEPPQASAPEPVPVAAVTDTDDELAALEAELNAATSAPPPEPKPEPKPEPVVAAEPVKPALKIVPTPALAPEPEAEPEPTPAPASNRQPSALQFFIDVEQFRDDTRVSENNLDNCLMQQAGQFAMYAASYARAEAQHLRLKARFEVIEAQLYDQHRKGLIAAGEKATEKQVENAVRQDPKWLKNRNVVIEAETIASINKGCVESLKQRRDMIIQLGADRREEGKGQVRIMAQEGAHRDAKARATAAFG
jgi:hypothetical protein